MNWGSQSHDWLPNLPRWDYYGSSDLSLIYWDSNCFVYCRAIAAPQRVLYILQRAEHQTTMPECCYWCSPLHWCVVTKATTTSRFVLRSRQATIDSFTDHWPSLSHCKLLSLSNRQVLSSYWWFRRSCRSFLPPTRFLSHWLPLSVAAASCPESFPTIEANHRHFTSWWLLLFVLATGRFS